MKNSRAKGARGELELAKFFVARGLRAERTQQYSGKGDESSDVVLKDFKNVHLECKRTEHLSLYDAIDQARDDSRGRLPVVAHRRNSRPWVFIIEADLFLDFLFHAGLIERHPSLSDTTE